MPIQEARRCDWWDRVLKLVGHSRKGYPGNTHRPTCSRCRWRALSACAETDNWSTVQESTEEFVQRAPRRRTLRSQPALGRSKQPGALMQLFAVLWLQSAVLSGHDGSWEGCRSVD